MRLIATFTCRVMASWILRDCAHDSRVIDTIRFLSLYIFSFCGWLPFFDAYTKSISSPGMIGLDSFPYD
jgi:hypothetical protein